MPVNERHPGCGDFKVVGDEDIDPSLFVFVGYPAQLQFVDVPILFIRDGDILFCLWSVLSPTTVFLTFLVAGSSLREPALHVWGGTSCITLRCLPAVEVPEAKDNARKKGLDGRWQHRPKVNRELYLACW